MKTQDLSALGVLEEVSSLIVHFLAGRGVSAEEASAAGRAITDQFVDVFGGQVVYIPRDVQRKRQERHAAIVADFNGRNHGALARKYGIGVQRVYRILQIERHRKLLASAPFNPQAPQQEQK